MCVIYYRNLNLPGTVRRWENKQYNSSHRILATDWTSKWNTTQSKNPNDYSLVCDRLSNFFFVTHTDKARQHFLQCCRLYGSTVGWEDHEVELASELDGVCAWDNPESALEWGMMSNIDYDKYVAFKGIFSCPVFEYDKGGVCAKVISPIGGIMSRAEFIEQYIDNKV